ncbi:MAG: hypothetical protein ACNI25_14915 [Halarcobacter sp.]
MSTKVFNLALGAKYTMTNKETPSFVSKNPILNIESAQKAAKTTRTTKDNGEHN